MKISRIFLFALFALATTISTSQIPATPLRPAHVSEKDYQLGVATLESANSQVKNDNFNVSPTDYWDCSNAYLQRVSQKRSFLIFFHGQKKSIHRGNF